MDRLWATGTLTIPTSSYSRRFPIYLQQLVDPPFRWEGPASGLIRYIRKHDTLSRGHLAFSRKGSALYRREWAWETWKEKPSLFSVLLYCSLCILFSDNGDELLLLRRNMSSSVDSLSAVNDFPLALEASSFLADGRASRLVFVGVGVCPTACLGSRQRYVDVHLLFDHFQFQR